VFVLECVIKIVPFDILLSVAYFTPGVSESTKNLLTVV